MGQLERQREVLRGLVGSIAKHDTLVTSTKLLQRLVQLQTLCNVRRLLLDSYLHGTGLIVETLLGAIIAYVFDGAADDFLIVKTGLGGDFTEDKYQSCGEGQRWTRYSSSLRTSLGGCLACYLRQRVFSKTCVEDSV